MSRDELRDAIKDLEPKNSVAADKTASVSQLRAELLAAKARRDIEMNVPPLEGSVSFRIEDTGFSWRIDAEDYSGPLEYGSSLPTVGSIVQTSEGTRIMVVDHTANLLIRAGDLANFREKFDQRRVYTTSNGADVVYKRTDPDTGKPILWSYKTRMEITVGLNMTLTRTQKSAPPIATIGKKMTQKVLAAYLIAQNPDITGPELTAVLVEEFPQCRISPRHGPHYISLSRSGNLPEPSSDDPRLWKR